MRHRLGYLLPGSIAVGLLLVGCGAEQRVSHDLAALYPEAIVRHESSVVDFGSEDARAAFVAGFSANETTGDGVSFVWSDGDVSELHLFLIEPRALKLSVRCWPFVVEGEGSQTVSLSLNGEALTTLELAPEPGEYHIALPADSQLPGGNVLRFRYGYDRAPSDVIPNARDDRRLGVAWDWLRVEGALEPTTPAVGEAGAIRVPVGARLDYFLAASSQSTFIVEAVRSDGPGVLVVGAETVSTQIEKRLQSPSRRAEIELPGSGGLVRLSLRAESADVVIRRPAIATSTPAKRDERAVGAAPPQRRPNIIVYLIDTLRADHLSAYGYSKPTPRIDALAEDGTLFERALAQASWTKPATASILTGLHPLAHTANQREDALPPTVRTMPEELKELGYETAALVVNANVSAPFGFDRGFDTFELLLHEDGILGARGDQLVDRAIGWLETRRSDDPDGEPFFLYLHTTDPHDPYATTGFHGDGFGSVSFMESLEEGRATVTPEELDHLVDLYDEDVAFADAQFGRFVDALKARGLYEDSLIVLLSDHGEEFDDHERWRHGKTLYGEQLRVPLIIKWPQAEGAGRRIDGLAQQIDLVPTVVDYVGGPRNEFLAGRSLWGLVNGEPSATIAAVSSYLLLDGREVESVVLGDYKLIRYVDYDREIAPYQLFDLSSDRGETSNVARERARLTALLMDYLRYASPEPAATRAPATIDEDVERQLRALGYVR